MAIYSASVKTISRSGGRSATAAAAYRTGEEVADQRTGEVHDYRRRGGVVGVSMLLPEGVAAMNTAELWNLAEGAEKRKNATVARELLVALPHELDT
ncbi:MobA/MobL family protein, partial [Pseudomonas putida]